MEKINQSPKHLTVYLLFIFSVLIGLFYLIDVSGEHFPNLNDHTIYYSNNNTCVANNLNFSIFVSNCYQQDIDGRNVEMPDVNFKWSGQSAKNISFIFAYDDDLESGKMFLKTNITKEISNYQYDEKWISNYLVTDVTSYQDISPPTSSLCELGTENNSRMYNVTRFNGLNNTIYCFTQVTIINSTAFRISGNASVWTEHKANVTSEGETDITPLVEYLGRGLGGYNLSFYKSISIEFHQNQEYKTHWVFTPKNHIKSGKWSILGYETEYGFLNSINDNRYVLLDPWWNASWGWEMNVTFDGVANAITNATKLLNITYNVNMSYLDMRDIRVTDANDTELCYDGDLVFPGVNRIIWVNVPYVNPGNDNNTIKVYYNANVSDGTNPYCTWANNYTAVWHMNAGGKDALGNVNMSNLTGTAFNGPYVLGGNASIFTNGQLIAIVPGGTETNNAFAFGTLPFTWMAWIKTAATNTPLATYDSDWLSTGGYGVGRFTGGTFRFDFSSANILSRTQTGINDNNWHLIMFVRNSTSEWNMYLDGDLNVTGGVNTYNANVANKPYYFGWPKTVSLTTIGTNTQDEVRFVKGRAMTGDEIKFEYQNNNFSSFSFLAPVQNGGGPPADTTFPLITITIPSTNNSNFNYLTNVNFTASDETALSTCWWTNNSGALNTTISCTTNITGTWPQGATHVIIWVNDTSNNVNSSRISFNTDTVFPLLSVLFPTNNIILRDYYNFNVTLNASATDTGGISTYWYSVNGASNVTFTPNTTFIASAGANNIRVYVNDTSNNLNTSSIINFNLTFTPKINEINISNSSISYSRLWFNKTGLVAWWKLDKNSTNQENSVDGLYNGTVSGATFTGSGKVGGAYNFDGVNDKITATTGNSPINGTYSIWIKKNLNSGDRVFNHALFYSFVNASGNFYHTYRNGSIYAGTPKTTTGGNNVWNNFVTVISSNGTHENLLIYANGVLEVNFTNIGPIQQGTDVEIGTADSLSYFNGTIDEVMIFNRTLSQSEIQQLYSVTNPTFQENANVTINATITDEDTAQASLYYKWTVNGTVVSSGLSNNLLNYIFTQKSQIVTLDVNDSDGYSVTQNWNITLRDLTNPSVTSLTETPTDPAQYIVNQNYSFNATVTDLMGVGRVLLEFNGTNYTATNSAGVYNVTLKNLSYGTYNYKWIANDTSGNMNATETGTYSVGYYRVWTLQQANKDNIADTYIISSAPTINYGTFTLIYLANDTYSTDDLIFRFNISRIPKNAKIVSSSLNLYAAVNLLDDASEGFNVTSHGLSNQTWIETFPTWNNFNWVVNPVYNSTQTDELWFFGGGGEPLGWQKWITSSITDADLSRGNNYSSIYLKSEKMFGTPNSDPVGIYSKEHTTASVRPFLNVTFADVSPDLIYPNVTNLTEFPSDPTIYSSTKKYEFNATVTDNIGLYNIYLEFNGVNYTATNITTRVYNVSFIGLSPGFYTYKWIAEDTIGNINSTETGNYTISQFLIVNITYPKNNTSHGFSGYIWLPLNVSINSTNPLSKMWYNVDNKQNTTFDNYTLVSLEQMQSTTKTYVINVFANDTTNLVNSSSVTVTISQTSPQGGGGIRTIGTEEEIPENDTTLEVILPDKCGITSVKEVRQCVVGFFTLLISNIWIALFLISGLFLIVDYFMPKKQKKKKGAKNE